MNFPNDKPSIGDRIVGAIDRALERTAWGQKINDKLDGVRNAIDQSRALRNPKEAGDAWMISGWRASQRDEQRGQTPMVQDVGISAMPREAAASRGGESLSPIAAFHQRREAYGLASSIKDVWVTEYDRMDAGLASQAARNLASFIERVEANPLAADLIERHQPGEIASMRNLLSEARQQARSEVATIYTGEWRQGGGLETKVEIGQSEAGFHYKVATSTQSRDDDGSWSAAMPNRQSALSAGLASESRIHGEDTPAQALRIQERLEGQRERASSDIWADRIAAGKAARASDAQSAKPTQGQSP